jgi:hypothetical protein
LTFKTVAQPAAPACTDPGVLIDHMTAEIRALDLDGLARVDTLPA